MTTGRLQIIEPLPIVGVVTSYDSSPTSQAKLYSDDPKEVFASPNALAQDIIIDLGNGYAVDSLFLGFTNATAAAQASLGTCTAINGTGYVNRVASTVIRPADCATVRSSLLFRMNPAPVAQYWYISLSANAGVNWQIGRIAAGLAFESAWDREWGSGRRAIDTAKVTQLVGGGFGVQAGARKAAYNWTFGDLDETELNRLWGIVYRVGNSSPIIVNEQDAATTAVNERLHYGLLQRFDPFERREPFATKWALEIEEWT
jgi:hypothetical protein